MSYEFAQGLEGAAHLILDNRPGVRGQHLDRSRFDEMTLDNNCCMDMQERIKFRGGSYIFEHWNYLALVLCSQFFVNLTVSAQPTTSPKGWFQTFEGGGSHQFSSDIDSGGDFEVSRFLARASIGYRSDYLNSTSFSFGYANTAYNFNELSGFGGLDPWDSIHTVSLSAPIRRGIGDRWMLLAIPSVRVIAEDNGDFGQAIVGGGIAGMSYNIRPGLSIGPGFGFLTQIEDSVNFFPILLVDWAFSDHWKLQTGRGFGASQGPGLVLSYSMSESWELLLGGRFERFRFRLNENGPNPNGVGEDRSASVSLGARYAVNNIGYVTIYGGVNMVGEFLIDDSSGNELFSSDYQSAPSVGFNATFRF